MFSPYLDSAPLSKWSCTNFYKIRQYFYRNLCRTEVKSKITAIKEKLGLLGQFLIGSNLEMKNTCNLFQ